MLEFIASKGPFGFLDGRPTDRDQPYSTVVRSMREIFVRRPDVQLEPWMRQALSHLLPELGDGKQIEAIQSEEELLRLYEAIGLLSYSVSNNAAAICSDDFHFWDDATLRATAYGAMKAMNAGQSSKVFTNYRKSELSPFTRGILDNYLQMGFAEEIELKPLTELQTLDLVRQLSGSSAERFSKRLYDVAGGNPFYSLEVLRHLFDIGLLEVRDGQWHTAFDADTADYRELAIPQTLKNTVLERVDRSGAGARRLLEAASLIGIDFRASDLEGATALSDWEQLEVLERAEQSQFITRVQTTSGHGFTFSHDLVRRSLRDGINPERKTLLHRKLGATAIHNAQAPEVIAEHLEQAGRYHEAAPYRLQAAEKLSRVFDHAEALEQYEKMLAYLPKDSSEMHLEALCLLGDTHLHMATFDQAKNCFDQAQKSLRFQHPPRLRSTIWIGLCRVAHGQSDVQRMLKCGQQALFFAWSSQDVLTNGLALRWLGFAEHQAGLWKTAKQHLAEAHMQFQSLGDKRNAAETLQIWALTLQSMGDSQGSQQLLEQSSGMYKLLDETQANPM